VLETMREQPLRPLSGVPDYVRGLSLIRGITTPVVSLSRLLEGGLGPESSRLVLVRAGEHQVALAVDSVLGVTDLDRLEAQELPALVSEIRQQHVASIHQRDGELVLLLSTARLLPAGLEAGLRLAPGTES
jgi:purine-binding chemotaxis protein CheW